MHKMGEWMVSYRYMSMEMDGLLSGSSNVTSNSQLGTMMMPIIKLRSNYPMLLERILSSLKNLQMKKLEEEGRNDMHSN